MRNLDWCTMRNVVVAGLLSLFALAIGGCGGSGGVQGKSVKPLPRIRIGRYASPSLGTVFEDPNDIGKHSYGGGGGEKKGIIYTCKAGHIDLAHTRKSADWTAYLYENFADRMKKKGTHLSFKFREPTRYYIELTYPDNWDSLPQNEKDRIVKDVSVRLAEYGAYVGTMWHEMLTWFGYKSLGLWSEFQSAFAWEDTFSDLFGTYMAGKALRDAEHDYDEAMTIALDRELAELDAQPKQVAVHASKSVAGQWFSGDFAWMNMKARNFDIGVDDGYITPWLVPGLAQCQGAKPRPYPAPNLDAIRQHGFKVKFELDPRVAQKGKILKIVWPDKNQRQKRLVPALHFAAIMNYVMKDAVEKHGIRTSPDFVTSEK